MRRGRKIFLLITLVLFFSGIGWLAYANWFRPTRILVVNPLPAQEAEIILNNDSRHIKVTCVAMEEAKSFDRYDAVLMYGRGLYLDSVQLKSLEHAARKGIPVFTNTLRNFNFVVNHNLDSLQIEELHRYFSNPCRENYRNMLRYVRSISTPGRIGEMYYERPKAMPTNMFYHLEAGKYFNKADELTEYLKDKGLYLENLKDKYSRWRYCGMVAKDDVYRIQYYEENAD